MTRSLIFLTLFSLSSLQFLSFAQKDGFLSPANTDISTDVIPNDVANTNNSFTVIGNSADEIGDAVSSALNLILNVVAGSADNIGNRIAANLIQTFQSTELAHQIGQIVSGTIKNLNDSNIVISDTIGDVVSDSVDAFRNARNRGEDVGAAVGAIVGDALERLRDKADEAGNTVEEAIDNAVDNVDNLSDQVQGLLEDVAEAIGQAVSSQLLLVGANADEVQDMVANAVNDGISQSEAGNTLQEIENSVNNLGEILQTNAGAIADAIANSTAKAFADEVEGITQVDIEDIRESIRSEVVRGIEQLNPSNEQIRRAINQVVQMNLAALGGNTVNVSDVINIIGEGVAIGVANRLNNQH